MKNLVLIPLFFASLALSQIPAPQINLSGNIGCQGFPCVNSGTLNFPSDANHTMTAQETSAFNIKVTSSGSLTATRNLIAPAGRFQFTIENATTGGQAIQVIGPSGTGVTIANGTTVAVWNDGTNYVQVGSAGSSGDTITSPGSTLSVGGSPTNTTLDVNLGHANTWTASQTFGGAGPAIKIPLSVATGTGSSATNVGSDSAGNLLLNKNGTAAEVCDSTNGVCSGGGVSSFAGRTGTVTPMGTDYSAFYCSIGGCGSSLAIQYMSIACPGTQNADPNAGGGTDGTACINALFAAATPTNPVTVWQDAGFTTVGTAHVGIKCPSAGNCTLRGNGGGISRTQITNCTISGGVAIFTAVNNLTAGETGTLANLVHCNAITNTTVTVLPTGLSGTQFEVAAAGTVASGAESGTFNRVYGTGFFLASGANDDMFANGSFNGGYAPNNCGIGASNPSQQGSNIVVRDLVLNGNANGQSDYCFGIHLANINGFLIDNVVLYNEAHFSVTCDNCSEGVIHGTKVFSSTDPIGTQTDGFHIDGPASDIAMSDNYLKTGDDGIALNAWEGFCGPIKRITIIGTTLDNAFSAVRMYNLNTNSCPVNGAVPLISGVHITGMSGTVAARPFIFGAGVAEQGTLNPAITDISMSDIDLTSPATNDAPFNVIDNVGDMALSNFTLRSPGYPDLFLFNSNESLGPQRFGSLAISNMRVVQTPAGHAFNDFFNPSGSPPTMTFGSLTVHGFGITWEGGSYSTAVLFKAPTAGGMNYLSMTDLDTTHAIPLNGDISPWMPSLLPNVFILSPGGLVTSSIQTYGSSTPTQGYSLGGQMSTPNGGVSGGSNCTFGGAIAPWACGSTYVNGSLVYFPLQHP